MSLPLMAREALPAAGQGMHKPLSFIENKGQLRDNNNRSRSDIQYKLATPGVNLYVGNGRLQYQFRKTEGTPGHGAVNTAYNMEVKLLGADVAAKATALEKQPYYENYYLAGTGDDGLTVHSYNKVVYKDVYPNIDWVLYVKDNQVEYDFVVKPGGDAAQIKLQYNGATALGLNADGGITAETPMGKVQEKTPVAYENATGRQVATRFAIHDNIVSFETGSYQGALTIDPSLLWGTYLGGTNEDVATSVKITAAGDVYAGGYSNSSAGIATTGSGYITSHIAGYDAFITRFNSTTGAMVNSSYFGGTGDDLGTCVAIDAAGTGIYLTGYTGSPAAGLTTSGAYHTTFGGGTYDGFLIKFSTALARTWSTLYGGNDDDYARGVTCDAANNVYITGQTASTTGIASSGAYQAALGGGSDAFVAKFLGTTGANVYSTYYGGSATEDGMAITVDATNNAVITGQTTSIIAVASTGAYHTTLSGASDAFIAKLNTTGTALTWGTYLGGPGTEEGRGIVCNTTTGDIAVTGYTTSSTGLATTGAYQAAYGGGAQDAFVAYFTNAGAIKWSTYYGGGSTDYGEGICLDPAKNIVIAGGTFSTSGIASTGSYQAALGGDYDAFAAKLTPLGQRIWGTYFGSTLYDYAYGVACNTLGQMVIAGHTSSTTGIATTGAAHTTYGGGTYDAFIAKFNTDVYALISQPYTDTLVCAGGTITIPYTVSAPFTAGNVFTAKLYSAAGTYIGNIGSITSTGSGTITGVIPSAAPAATGYRIRLVATSPAYTSPDEFKNIQIVSALPHTIVTGNSPVCVDGTLNLHDQSTTYVSNYSWYNPSGSFFALGPDATVSPVALTDAGTYSVVTTHNGCPDDIATFDVLVNDAHPAAPTATASTLNCVGGTISLMATASAGATATYSWTGPASYSSTMQNPSISGITTANAGTYTVIDTVDGCWSPATSVTVTVTGTTATSVSISVSPDDTVCGGTLVTFTAMPVNGGISPTYQWVNGGADVVGAISSTWSSSTLLDGTSVYVVMHSNAVCPAPANATSNTIKMNVITNEPVVHIYATPGGASVVPGASVTFTSLTYNVGSGSTYQWQRNGADIPGATDATYTLAHVTEFDTIRLVATSTMHCASTNFGISNEIVAHPNTAVANVSSSLDNITVFPNPNTGTFTISGDLQATGISHVDIAVLNALGQVVYTVGGELNNSKLNSKVSMANMPAGTYLLQITAEGRSKTIRFSLQH